MASLGELIKILGYIVWVGTGIWGFFLCIGIISNAAGFWGIVAALFLGPITFFAAPLHSGFALGDWFPLILNYGGSICAFILIAIGGAFAGD